MINQEILNRFISDLGTITCSDVDALNYFRSFGVDPKEYMSALGNIPGIHIINEKIWFQE